jgi:hypothetical protein
VVVSQNLWLWVRRHSFPTRRSSDLGTAVSVAATAQELEDDHNGNVWDYVTDKYNSLKSYAERKLN